MIRNHPVKYINDYAVNSVRSAYENAGRWYCYLTREDLGKGLPLEFVKDAMRASGRFQAQDRYRDVSDPQGFIAKYMDFEMEKAFEGEVAACSETEAEIALGYCPLLAAWQKLGCEEALIRDLCRCCREMDMTAASELGIEMSVSESLAEGGEKCTVRFRKP